LFETIASSIETGRRNWLLAALTFASGSIDTISFLALGKVFTAFVTGNVAFLGLRIAGAPGPYISSVAVSMISFMAGVFLGSRLLLRVPESHVWSRRVTGTI